MPMQEIQGMPLQAGSTKTNPDSVKLDPADFLNVLTALLLSSPQPQPGVNYEAVPSAEVKSAAPQMDRTAPVQVLPEPPVLTVEEQQNINAQGVLLNQLVPGQQETPGLTQFPGTTAEAARAEILTPIVSAELKNAPPQRLVPEETEQVPNQVLKTKVRPNSSPVEPKAWGEPEELQPQALESDKTTQSAVSQTAEMAQTYVPMPSSTGENRLVVPGRKGTAAAETVNQAKSVADIQADLPQAALAEMRQPNGQNDQLAMDLKRQEELPAQEENSLGENAKTFADYLPKDMVTGKELKAVLPADFKVASQELAQELPRLIESQIKNTAGKEISRDIIIHLEPKELGKLTVKLTAQEGIVTVKIFTELAETKNLVEAGFANLRQSFSEQGIKYGRMEVELGGQFLFQQQQQPQHQQQGQQSLPAYWNQRGRQHWEDFGPKPEENYSSSVSRLTQNSAVDYRV